MKGEFLSIETVQKIAILEKENREYEKIIYKLDEEVNRLFNIIKEANIYIKNNFSDTSKKIAGLNSILNKCIIKSDEDKDGTNI